MGFTFGPNTPEGRLEGLEKLAEAINKPSNLEEPLFFENYHGDTIAIYTPGSDVNSIWEALKVQNERGDLSNHRLVTSTYLLEQRGLKLRPDQKTYMQERGY